MLAKAWDRQMMKVRRHLTWEYILLDSALSLLSI